MYTLLNFSENPVESSIFSYANFQTHKSPLTFKKQSQRSFIIP